MRRFILVFLFLVLVLLLVSPVTVSQVQNIIARRLVTDTVANLPAAGSEGRIQLIRDGADSSDCSTGSGSTYVVCVDTGAAWTATGGAGSLAGLSDTDITSPANLDVLCYNSSSGNWENCTSVLTFGFMLGAENGAALTTADDQPSIFVNRSGRSLTLTEVWIECDAVDASTSFNLQNDDGTPANILTADVTCNTTGQTGTLDGTEKVIADGSRIDLLTVTASAAKRATIWFKYQ